MSSAYTLKLDDSWDLTLDANGHIVTTTGAYAIAQNVANAVRLFENDAYFDADRGIPHLDISLGASPQLNILRSRIKAAALEVDGVESASVKLDAVNTETRELTGEIQLTLADGATASVSIGA